MNRLLHVEVDRHSWPRPGPPHYPPTFPAVNGLETFNIPSVLLAIGLLTTPSHTSGVSLSEFWAWVRYLHAVSDEDDLRLTRGFSDLDAHQKTILSDDFGMGVPMLWLLSRLNLGPVCDGRYFIERMMATTGAQAVKTSKRGPNKSPDFVAQDLHGVWHVIECKGTQSGGAYRERQLGDLAGPHPGALAQKRTIIFPPGHTGQRLACGLMLGTEKGKEGSSLKIVDPPGEDNFEVGHKDLGQADDAVTRATTARTLRLAGFEATSLAFSAPDGPKPSSMRTEGKREERRREFVEEKSRRATEELRVGRSREAFQAKGERYRGRTVEMELPAPISIDGRETRRVRIRQGVNVHALAEIARRPVIEGLLVEADSPWRESLGATQITHGDGSARLRIGHFFVSEIDLDR